MLFVTSYLYEKRTINLILHLIGRYSISCDQSVKKTRLRLHLPLLHWSLNPFMQFKKSKTLQPYF